MISVKVNKKLGNFNLNMNFKLTAFRNVIFGISGSGKSSLLKMLAGFYNPDFGCIVIKDKVFFSSEKSVSLPIQDRRVGYLPQEYTLFPNMTIRENIEYGLRKRKLRDEFGLESIAKRFGIFDCLNKYPYQISGGQKQRAALARALIIKPDILLLDEPFSALDRPTREELRELVAEIAESFSIPVLFVTHDLEEAFVFGEEVVIVESGSVVEYGIKSEIFNRPRFVNTAKLLGFNNIWEIDYKKNGVIKLKNGLVLESISTKRARFCCIKPEDVMILRDDTDISDKENKIKVMIKRINFRGKYVNLATLTDNGVEIFINIPPHVLNKMSLHEGCNVVVSLKKESIVLCEEV